MGSTIRCALSMSQQRAAALVRAMAYTEGICVAAVLGNPEG